MKRLTVNRVMILYSVTMDSNISIKEVTDQNWNDMQELFGEKGAYGGCWCTYFRLKRSEFQSLPKSGRKEMMSEIISSGKTPGIMAYMEGKPVGWCSVAPREEFILLSTSRIMKPVDSKPVWSIVCFYIDKKFRRKGVMKSLIGGALKYAEKNHAGIVEAYPVDSGESEYPEPYAYTGLYNAFVDLGFKEVERRSPKRPIMRYYLEKTQ